MAARPYHDRPIRRAFVSSPSSRRRAESDRLEVALRLELTAAGFDASVLSEFGTRLVTGNATRLLLAVLLEQLTARGLLQANRRQPTDSPHVLGAVSGINRLAFVRETMRAVLETLVVVAPTWLQTHAHAAWRARYQPYFGERLPKRKDVQRACVEQIGMDGAVLLAAISADDASAWLRHLPAVEVLRHVWLQNYVRTENAVCWRTPDEPGLPPSRQFISSPYDLDARYAQNYSTSWIGYNVHLTETGERDAPN